MWMLKMENMFNHRNNPISHRAIFPNIVQLWGNKTHYFNRLWLIARHVWDSDGHF